MKKFIKVLLIITSFLLLMSISGCGGAGQVSVGVGVGVYYPGGWGGYGGYGGYYPPVGIGVGVPIY